MINIFSFEDYIDVIRSMILHNKGERGYQAKLAKAARCNRSYLSQVLNGHVNLTPDHGAGIADFWHCSDDEMEYFILLINLARAATPRLKSTIKRRLMLLIERNSNLHSGFKTSQGLSDEDAVDYYSAWYYSAIHVIIGIPEYRTEKSIAERLGLNIEIVRSVLNRLMRMNVVTKEGHEWKVLKFDLHLQRLSALKGIGHANWRQKTALRLQEDWQKGFHYSGVHSLSVSDAQKIKDIIIEAITRSREIIAPSNEEDIYCFLCDFYSL
ncbi:MAG: TIGR02147 family protein [Oligoflexia bacterium]|nr:TIGR02147 family protein [Oligoflexia bacterium]